MHLGQDLRKATRQHPQGPSSLSAAAVCKPRPLLMQGRQNQSRPQVFARAYQQTLSMLTAFGKGLFFIALTLIKK